MRYYISIQSVSDLITNSSSEIYTINTDISIDLFKDWYYNCLLCWGYSENTIFSDRTISGYIYQVDPETIVLSYGVMCNVDEDIYGLLRNMFGKENVQADY